MMQTYISNFSLGTRELPLSHNSRWGTFQGSSIRLSNSVDSCIVGSPNTLVDHWIHTSLGPFPIVFAGVVVLEGRLA